MYTVSACENASQAAAMFVVPKRNFKRAHDRNLLKRRMREVYRKTKATFLQKHKDANVRISICFLYTSKNEEAYSKIEQALQILLDKIKIS